MTILTCEFFKMNFIGLVDILCTIALVFIYFRQMTLMKNQKELQDKQLEIQRNSIDLGPAQLLQNLYFAFQNYHVTILLDERDLLMPGVDFRIDCSNRLKELAEANGEFAQELAKLQFIVSKSTYDELNEYYKCAERVGDLLFNSLAPALVSYEASYKYSDEYDRLLKSYQEASGFMPIGDYMDEMAKLDDHKDPYLNYKQAKRNYDSLFNSISKKFESRFGFGNLL